MLIFSVSFQFFRMPPRRGRKTFRASRWAWRKFKIRVERGFDVAAFHSEIYHVYFLLDWHSYPVKCTRSSCASYILLTFGVK